MSGLILWKDQEMSKLRRDIDRLFDRCRSDFGVCRFLGEVSEGFSIKLTESEDTLIVRAELEGVNPENLDVSITHDTLLTIKGEKRVETVEDGGYYHRVKRSFRSFSRTFRLPCRVRVGETKATYKKGILKVVMPKWKPQRPRCIKVEIKT
ncbi:MAG: Hsp20/alpha crystallin family protein [Deltaproteobacteria bacterium]|nr:Hsp20/alpha crystallin family protein [Deltaproteobacteria bacterium]